ncbi:hypothetical protein COU96_01545 [Candidatus Shapirobacteria bacterium CG10_big_fil_rev_8_21_14_0_10_38_14]|uniref:Zinc finger DksA/TraR C4-type domain-containing protein n=1 Tax=Candidatus Shapirobacteria bacterium CG10_big_fil_rev_8_21_14_0_10_38_14 TaxID=1974483 RepID=A0A2M8L5J2_9BACT|nr:MAG: hypothetical protein COU96_01545 [Candidatus Shapirobacteria bacterium CG10_big_fil_rev_8_21_14_0_10_38_14]
MITQEEKDRVRRELEPKKRNLEEASNRFSANAKLREAPKNREELAVFSTDLKKEETNHKATEEMLKAVTAALGRLDDGTWGECVDCGNEISEDRRAAMCWVSRCKPCQEKKGVKVR